MEMLIVGKPKTNYNNTNLSKSTIGAPNWESIPHKGMPRPSEDEYGALIDSCAKLLVESADNSRKYEAAVKQVDKLMAQYVSVVSPDRKALVKETKDFFNSAFNFMKGKKTKGGTMTLFDYMLQKEDAKLKFANDGLFSIELNTGTSITFTGCAQQPNMFDIKQCGSDQPVIIFHGDGWAYHSTPEEQMRETSFCKQLNDTVKRYTNTMKKDNSQAVQVNEKLNVIV